jgi:YfiH family protein
VFYRDSTNIYRVTELDEFPWLLHGFGTRLSDVPAQLAPFAELAMLKQVHGCVCVPAEGRSGVLGPGDALLENNPCSVIAVKTADCIPILLVDERRQAVAAVHAGWRGTAARIAMRAVEAMGLRFGSAPADLHAAIGPGIGKCCYEVGPEVMEQFGAASRGAVRDVMAGESSPPGAAGIGSSGGFQGAASRGAARDGRAGKSSPPGAAGIGSSGSFQRSSLDLPAENARQLEEAGVTRGRVYASNLCTMCRSEEFHSFRRDQDAAGRMYSFAGIL